MHVPIKLRSSMWKHQIMIQIIEQTISLRKLQIQILILHCLADLDAAADAQADNRRVLFNFVCCQLLLSFTGSTCVKQNRKRKRALANCFKMAEANIRVRRGYSAQFVVKERSNKFINPLHLTVSRANAKLLKKVTDDDTFVCALRIERCENSPSSSANDSPSKSKEDPSFLEVPESPAPVQATSTFWSAEDIAVCVWAQEDCDDVLFSPEDDSDELEMTLFCTSLFLTHYNLRECTEVFIRPLQVYPISRAVFSVSDADAYDWLQREKFSRGLLLMICKHDILVVQNDILLSPYPEMFLEDTEFHRSWYFKIKAIACAPFLLGLMSSNTEIIICFEDEAERLPSDHGHLSSSSLDKYVSGALYVSDFCRSLSADSGDGTLNKDSSQSPVDTIVFNACVIQQERNWRSILSNADNIDLNTIIGIPRKLMLQHGLFDGSLLKISVHPMSDTSSSPDLLAIAMKANTGAEQVNCVYCSSFSPEYCGNGIPCSKGKWVMCKILTLIMPFSSSFLYIFFFL